MQTMSVVYYCVCNGISKDCSEMVTIIDDREDVWSASKDCSEMYLRMCRNILLSRINAVIIIS